MVFAQGALGVLLIGFLLFCLLDVITTDASEVRHLPKFAWILLVVLINPVGGIAWLLVGRPKVADRSTTGRGITGGSGPRSTGRGSILPPHTRTQGPVAPDDDPEFLAELRRREEELKRQRRERGEDPDTGTGTGTG